MGLYITYTRNIRKRKIDYIFSFENGTCYLLQKRNKSNESVFTFNDDILKGYAGIVDYAEKHAINAYEIVIYENTDIEVLLTFFSNYINDKDISVGLITLDKYLIDVYRKMIETFGATIATPLDAYRNAMPSFKYSYEMLKADTEAAESANLAKNVFAKRKPIKLDESFHDKFMRFLIESGLQNVDIYKQAGVSRQVFSKILSDKDIIPTKLTIISLCIGMRLTLYDAKELIHSAGYSLSKSITFDSIIINYLSEEIYDYDLINSELNEYGCPLLGWHPRD